MLSDTNMGTKREALIMVNDNFGYPQVPTPKTWTKKKLNDLRLFYINKSRQNETSTAYSWIASRKKGQSTYDPILYCAFDDLPLFINIDSNTNPISIDRAILLWRLEQGK